MKHSFTAMVTIAAAAGFAGMVQAQTTAPATTPPAQTFQGAAPSAQYNQNQSTAAPSAQAAPTAAPTTNSQAGMQQPTGMQQPAPTAMQQPAGMQPSASAGLSSRGMSRDDLMQAQEQLQAQGLYRGPIDGVMGSGTRRGLAQFQRQNGLPPSGTLDPQPLASLSGGGMSNAGSPSVGGGTPPVGTSAPLGATGQSYNS